MMSYTPYLSSGRVASWGLTEVGMGLDFGDNAPSACGFFLRSVVRHTNVGVALLDALRVMYTGGRSMSSCWSLIMYTRKRKCVHHNRICSSKLME
ncbi:unnamed protein product [Microthlaspi erraticum]|uniref:Uncharacterized protein n=1 Tax=Microthlaspi erraticum TaxID=1685480 RepID=A0A6D2L8I2_9BRAS|nr:unnamed protein product [Microthlaspi erraticum]